MSEPCPVCTTEARLMGAHDLQVDCPRCGRFATTEEAMDDLRSRPLTGRDAANASGWITETATSQIATLLLTQMRSLATPSVRQRTDRLLLRLQKETPVLGAPVVLDEGRRQAYVAVTYSQNEGELRYLIESLMHRELLADLTWINPRLTHNAYAYIDDHLVKNAESPIGFCAMWFDDQVLPLWVDSVSPAIVAAGYEPLRLDKSEHNNRIDDEIIASIRRARFLIADLTAHRQGVYFEAGLAMGLGLPVIWMVRQDDRDETHFDIRQFNCIDWSPDNLVDARSRLQNRIEATIGRGPRRTS